MVLRNLMQETNDIHGTIRKMHDGYERTDKIVSAVGSLGEGLVSASALAGPTPLGAGLMIGGAVLWGASALYSHIGGSKTVVKAAKAVADGAKKAWNKVTSWF